MDVLACPAWCQPWCHSCLPTLSTPKSALWLCSLASPSPVCLPVLLLLLSGEVAELPGLPPQPQSPLGLLCRKQSPREVRTGWRGAQLRGQLTDPKIWSQAKTGEYLGLGLSDPPGVTVIGHSRNCLK